MVFYILANIAYVSLVISHNRRQVVRADMSSNVVRSVDQESNCKLWRYGSSWLFRKRTCLNCYAAAKLNQLGLGSECIRYSCATRYHIAFITRECVRSDLCKWSRYVFIVSLTVNSC
jgi:hypothetical protein